MQYFFTFFKAFLLLIIMVGCKKENPNPELLDPIYKDLQAQLKEVSASLESEKGSLESALKDLSLAEPRTADKKIALKAVKKARGNVKKLEQQKKYLSIRVERRKIESRKQYRINFHKNIPWPNPKEYQAYLQNKKMNEIDMNWQSRVPKLFKENPNYKPPQLDTEKKDSK